ncbi:hypothetical protein [Gemmobacter sp. 24YEA27]|uniref:hypothetical protein n=1 Tax=Gemmobacter sp. 24YEA27 TaxID=3040672 RepID=UPI0024B3B09A|nr:hypothetical protein [Gemmobacter sp. 24YEA27]
MTHSHHNSFRPVGQILAVEVLPRLQRASRLPLRVSCIGTGSFGVDASGFDHSTPLGEGQSPEEAMSFATLRVSRGDIRAGSGNTLRFRPRLVVIQDRELGLVLAGEIRGGVILWQQPVASDAQARRIMLEASRLRGMAFNMPDQGPARELRHRASLCEARLVDPFWREVAAELLALPQAA